MVDLTDVKGLFGLVTFKVGVVFDVFSRMPLLAMVFSKEPSAVETARFVSKAARLCGLPSHFVSDQAHCFKGRVFRRKLRRLGVKPRFGAIGKKGSIALIERLWRTLKDTLGLRLLRPLAAEDLAEKIQLGLVHYAHFRPHQGLGGATPAEMYFGRALDCDDVCVLSGGARRATLVPARRDELQFPLRPYNGPQFPLHPYTVGE